MSDEKRMEIEVMDIDSITPASYNPRADLQPGDEEYEKIKRSIEEFSLVEPLVWNRRTKTLVGGHQRLKVLRDLGHQRVEVVIVDMDRAHEKALNVALNRVQGRWDYGLLRDLLTETGPDGLDSGDLDITLTGFGMDEIEALLTNVKGPSAKERVVDPQKLADVFGAPPFSVLDGRQGWWVARKHLWILLGINSEAGRSGKLMFKGPTSRDPSFYPQKTSVERKLGHKISTEEFMEKYYVDHTQDGVSSSIKAGTSVFDPVLCELSYRWFTPRGARILDIFSGGSVRGIVAAMLGRNYVGIDIREEQVEANRDQWKTVREKVDAEGLRFVTKDAAPDDYTPEYTPLEEHGGFLVKRDDLWQVAGVGGGKSRAAWHLAQGAPGVVTAGARQSPQVAIVSSIAQRLGIPCQVHVPEGADTPEIEVARNAGAEVVKHKFGRNSVIVARAREAAEQTGYRLIPFGMECEGAIEQTASQIGNLPKDIKRLVVPVGSAMSLAGILRGLERAGRLGEFPILGVSVGADPTKRLNKWAPAFWEQHVEIVKSDYPYEEGADITKLGDLELDPIYESKCIPFLREGDILWVVGKRPSKSGLMAIQPGDAQWIHGDALECETVADGEFDFLYTCPPYGDLEVYSDDPRDLSTMDVDKFRASMRQAIHAQCSKLRENRFAAIVVGDYRDQKGLLQNFVNDTVEAFLTAGLSYYNEVIYVTPLGSLPIRVKNGFGKSRKLGKTHQNLLVFVKGDPVAATEYAGIVDGVDMRGADDEVEKFDEPYAGDDEDAEE